MEAAKKTSDPQSIFYVGHWFGIRPTAFIEMGIFFILFFAYDIFFGSGDRMIGTYLHPFWIIIILMTVQYGIGEGIIAVAISTLLLFVGNIPLQELDESFFDYQLRVYMLPFLWLAATLIIGELEERKEGVKQHLEADLAVTRIREKEITRSYESLKAIKEGLESRLAGQMKSSVATYQALKEMEHMKPAKVLLGMESLVKEVLSPQKFSLYALGPSGLEATIESGWDDSDAYLRRFPQDSEMFLHIVGNQKVLSVLKREDQMILKGEGMLAAPLIDEDSRAIFGMLKIEELKLEDLNMTNIETFRSICEFAGIAYSHAKHYQDLLKNSIYETQYHTYSFSLLEMQENYLSALFESIDLPIASIKVDLSPQLGKNKEIVLSVAEKLKHVVPTIFGPLGQLYHTKPNKASFTILAPCIHAELLEFSVGVLESELNGLDLVEEGFVRVKTKWLYTPDKELIT